MYVKPELEIIELPIDDIMTESGAGATVTPNPNENDGDIDWDN